MDANSKLIESCYAAFGRGDIPFILGILTDDVDWRGPTSPEIPYHGDYRGKSGAGQFFERIGTSMTVTGFTPTTYLSAGDEVMTTGNWTGIATSTGKTFSTDWAMRFKV